MSESTKEVGRDVVPKQTSKGFWEIAEQAELRLGKNRSGKGLGAFLLALIAIATLATIVLLIKSGVPAELVGKVLEWWTGTN